MDINTNNFVAKKSYIAEYEKIDPVMQIDHLGIRLKYATPNKTTLWRAESLFTKEPDTIEWISSFRPGSVFFDIGANVGMYSIFAAKFAHSNVYAFEPEAGNYALLNKNISLNLLSSKVVAYPLSLSSNNLLGELHLSDMNVGGSCHAFGEKTNYAGNPFTPKFTQGSVSLTLDELVFEKGLSPPNYLKIDVDGIEPEVLLGASKVLATDTLHSVLVEINTLRADHGLIPELMSAHGFIYSPEAANKGLRQSGPFKGTGNYIFTKPI